MDLEKAQLKHYKTNQLQTDSMPLISSDMPITKENIIQARFCRPHSMWKKINKLPPHPRRTHTDALDGATVSMNMVNAELIGRHWVWFESRVRWWTLTPKPDMYVDMHCVSFLPSMHPFHPPFLLSPDPRLFFPSFPKQFWSLPFSAYSATSAFSHLLCFDCFH